MTQRMRPLMVLGCTSGAGKSLLVTALARWFARQGVDVVPFKAQNMSNNARVVAGGEIGVAQWLQARAAGREPVPDMNPVLLKPEADTRSQVVVAGRPRHDLTAMPWGDRGPHLWPAMAGAFDRLHGRHELVVVEGAGSPAEINLPDMVNNRVLVHADASAVLVADIDRGGAFAHLFGTWALVPEETRRRLAAFVLNRFRGDADLLEPGPALLAERTGMRAAGVVPLLDHELPDEEGATVRARPPAGAPVVAVVRYPFASNLDELHLLGHAAHVRWATRAADLDGADLVVLPGSKHVAADVAWVRRHDLDAALVARAALGGRILGICGGCMMLGESVVDGAGVEGATRGLGLLTLRTDMDPAKVTRATTVTFPPLGAPWTALGGVEAAGYEIRNGQVTADGCRLAPLLWGSGSVLGTTVHGLLESPAVLEALCGQRPPPVLDATFDALADAVDEHLDTRLLWDLVRPDREAGLRVGTTAPRSSRLGPADEHG
ncbi:MAG: cobyric acid synthase [Acidimicrobiales bacterium]|nr:cobyric acid synthase [Acidimicrobiales bacterium]